MDSGWIWIFKIKVNLCKTVVIISVIEEDRGEHDRLEGICLFVCFSAGKNRHC